MKKQQLNIFYTLDENFVIPFTVSMISLIENNKDIDLNIRVIHSLKNDKVLKEINEYVFNRYGFQLNLQYFSTDQFGKLPTSSFISKASYTRLLISDIVPENIFSGLYLDCDTVVTGSIRELADPGLFMDNEYCLLAAEDLNGKENVERFAELGVKTQFYFNTGVLMINIERWRIENAGEKLLQTAFKYLDKLKWHDQDILNIYFAGKSGVLNRKFNCITKKKIEKKPAIIHYSGASKPWHYIDNGPYKSEYKKYFKLTPFKDVKTEEIGAAKVYRKYLELFKSKIGVESFSDTFNSFFK